jgi:hypothetical protein
LEGVDVAKPFKVMHQVTETGSDAGSLREKLVDGGLNLCLKKSVIL